MSCGAELAPPARRELNQRLAAWLARRPRPLSGAEIRSLRKVMGWSGRAFALPIGGTAERLLRVLVSQRIEPITDYAAFERWMTRLSQRATEASGAREEVRVCQAHGAWEAPRIAEP